MYEYATHILESYHYIHNERLVNTVRTDGVRIFLDSGAFSAFTQGVQMDLGKYCDYIHKNADIIKFASVLDAIGDPEGTWRNQMAMEARGTRPLPCYHYGEPTEVLDWYVANYEYITIGGMVPISTPQLKIWLDRIWERHLTNADGTPKIKVHGFGLTSPLLMTRYPWYSVDSSSWQAIASNGSIMMPRKFAGTLAISKKAAQRKVAGQHFDTMPAPQQAAIRAEIEELGGDVDRLSDHYSSRWAWNVWALPQIAQNRGLASSFEAVQPELF